MPPSEPLAKAHFGDHFHACAFVMGPDEERSVIDPFLIEGMKRGEKAVYIVDPYYTPAPQMLRELQQRAVRA